MIPLVLLIPPVCDVASYFWLLYLIQTLLLDISPVNSDWLFIMVILIFIWTCISLWWKYFWFFFSTAYDLSSHQFSIVLSLLLFVISHYEGLPLPLFLVFCFFLDHFYDNFFLIISIVIDNLSFRCFFMLLLLMIYGSNAAACAFHCFLLATLFMIFP